MNNLTKFQIGKPAREVFEAFVDPGKIGNFWFSSSSGRWEPGKTITLIYEEYNAKVEITIKEIEANRKIVFEWGAPGEENVVTIRLTELEQTSTIIEVNEEGFQENDEQLIEKLVGNKEGWVFVLACLKGYLEFGITKLRTGLMK